LQTSSWKEVVTGSATVVWASAKKEYVRNVTSLWKEMEEGSYATIVQAVVKSAAELSA
jgi:hypothetical protein